MKIKGPRKKRYLQYTKEREKWRTQASLPVRAGGIGICSAVQLASSTFLSSSASSAHLVGQILPEDLKRTTASEVQQALMEWFKLSHAPSPSFPTNLWQGAWDSRRVSLLKKIW